MQAKTLVISNLIFPSPSQTMSSGDYNVVIDVDDEGDLGNLEFNQNEFHHSSELSSLFAAAIAKKQISIMKLAEKFRKVKLAEVRIAKLLYFHHPILIFRYRAYRRILQQSICCPQQRLWQTLSMESRFLCTVF